MKTAHNVLILPSKDGEEYTRVILYPAAWTPEQAAVAAIAAFEAAQTKNPEEWSWDDYEPELVTRGFIVPCWHHGPVWDEEV